MFGLINDIVELRLLCHVSPIYYALIYNYMQRKKTLLILKIMMDKPLF